jgi:hypothetical protein
MPLKTNKTVELLEQVLERLATIERLITDRFKAPAQEKQTLSDLVSRNKIIETDKVPDFAVEFLENGKAEKRIDDIRGGVFFFETADGTDGVMAFGSGEAVIDILEEAPRLREQTIKKLKKAIDNHG